MSSVIQFRDNKIQFCDGKIAFDSDVCCNCNCGFPRQLVFCDCLTADYGALNHHGDATLTLSGTPTPNPIYYTQATQQCAAGTAPSIAGSYVAACGVQNSFWSISTYVCNKTISGSNYAFFYCCTVGLDYTPGSAGSFTITASLRSTMRAIFGGNAGSNPFPTLAFGSSCPLESYTQTKTWTYSGSPPIDVDHYTYDTDDCDPECATQGVSQFRRCETTGGKTWTTTSTPTPSTRDECDISGITATLSIGAPVAQ